jgi:hypothetical protein
MCDEINGMVTNKWVALLRGVMYDSGDSQGPFLATETALENSLLRANSIVTTLQYVVDADSYSCLI